MLIYGINSVAEALRAGRVRRLRIARRDDERLRRLVEDAEHRGVAVERASVDVLDRETRQAAHQGVVATVMERTPITVKDLVRSDQGPPLIVVLDGSRVAEQGSHDELMARGGLYAELYGIQARAYQ